MKKLNKRGFTIVELVVVIAVIAILAAVLIPSFSGIVAKAKNAAACENVHNAYTATLVDESEKTTKTFTDAVEKASADGLIVKIGDDSDVIYVKLSKNGVAEVATNTTSADWEVKDGLIVEVSAGGAVNNPTTGETGSEVTTGNETGESTGNTEGSTGGDNQAEGGSDAGAETGTGSTNESTQSGGDNTESATETE